ncbi:MAG TPA: hypothetical protein VHV55_14655 [Pirellulales bacterium]|nr:hypothetical protein [Pirellulales bacterium]
MLDCWPIVLAAAWADRKPLVTAASCWLSAAVLLVGSGMAVAAGARMLDSFSIAAAAVVLLLAIWLNTATVLAASVLNVPNLLDVDTRALLKF